MRGIKLSKKELYAIIINTPKYGVRRTAKILGRNISSIYYVNSMTKKYGYQLIPHKQKLTTQETIKSILKKLKKI